MSKMEEKKEIIRLSEKEYLILGLLISRGEMYGLSLVEGSEGQLKKGTVYVTLQRMVEKGLIESREEPREMPEVGIPRRIYVVTGVGERIYRAQTAANEQFNLVWGGV